MALPTYQDVMLPLLRFTGTKDVFSIIEAVTGVSDELGLTDEERSQLLPSGKNTIMRNRISWARTYMSKAGLIVRLSHNKWKITDEGLKALKENPEKINNRFLNNYPIFKKWREESSKKKGKKGNGGEPELVIEIDPMETIESGYQQLRDQLADDLLEQVKAGTSEFFERLVVDLLVKMGYGGSFADAAKAVGKSGDGGIDGIIKEDRLGLDVIYVQAKRYKEQGIGRPVVQSFVGAIHGRGARKGVFLTTSKFSKEATQYASSLTEPKVVLIDGHALAEYMIDFDVGVSAEQEYAVKRLDADFFEEP